MCHQTVGLIQGVLEEAGMATVSVSALEEITRKVGPPRALFVPFPLGYPLGRPHDVALQRKVILRCLELLDRTDLPVFATFREE
jgi:D-proline reductase (dithiol) PrdB